MSVLSDPIWRQPSAVEVVGAQREPAADGELRLRVPMGDLARALGALRDNGARFVTLMRNAASDGDLVAVVAYRGDMVSLRSRITESRIPDLGLRMIWPAARWAEIELLEHEVAAVTGHGVTDLVSPSADRISKATAGQDVFPLPLGPVRSGVYEAVQFVIETGGESTARVQVRPFFKRRGLELRMSGMSAAMGAHVAERIAGIASVAYASAYAAAVERALGVTPPPRAVQWRALHGELERIACHLDVIARQAEAAALAVAQARLLILKEQLLQARCSLCGSRFGRGVVIPGGVAEEGRQDLDDLQRALEAIERDVRRDRDLFMGTASMTDRLIGSGFVGRDLIEEYGAVGPVARGSGISTDARHERPYGAYVNTGLRVVTEAGGDAYARIAVRFGEIAESFHVIRQAIEELRRADGSLSVSLPDGGTGAAFGWSEAPQGELVIWADIRDGLVVRAHVASPSYRNLALFEHAFPADVLTDFAFIEHSFGVTMAGVDR